MTSLLAWFEHRTGLGALARAALYEHVPGGARWRYVWGSTLVFAFFVQAVTGVVLWMSYSPSGQTAWESVYYIQSEMSGGWLLRGVHHFMAQAMVVLLALHLLQVVVDGAYRAPREVNFWIGLVLMQIVLALSLTGYLLPWDQKGYWATSVATNLVSVVPLVGESLQQLVVGGPEYGHHTLTRFFALHAGVLPGLLIVLLVAHVALFRRHGLHARTPLRGPDGSFWPDQILRDAVACLAVLAVVLLLCIWSGFGSEQGLVASLKSDRPGEVLGADLGAPADGSAPFAAARPEWYFLFLFQFLKLFEGYGETGELVGAVIVPGAVVLVLFLMPLLGRWKVGHWFNVLFLFALLFGIGLLTVQALWDDRRANWIAEPDADNAHARERWQASVDYLAAVEGADVAAHRARQLARGMGIPPTGAITLLRNDPKLVGPVLFEQNCASCHAHVDPLGSGIPAPEPSAPNLYGFASRRWIAGVLDPHRVATPEYFGNTEHKEGDMVTFVQGDEWKEISEADRQDVIAALSARAALPSQAAADQRDAERIAAGAELIRNAAGCVNCHPFREPGEAADPDDLGIAPDLTNYGTREWLIGMISDPNHAAYYTDRNDRMPAFAPAGAGEFQRLSTEQIGMLADWLRGDWFEADGEATAKESAKPASQTSAPPETDGEQTAADESKAETPDTAAPEASPPDSETKQPEATQPDSEQPEAPESNPSEAAPSEPAPSEPAPDEKPQPEPAEPGTADPANPSSGESANAASDAPAERP